MRKHWTSSWLSHKIVWLISIRWRIHRRLIHSWLMELRLKLLRILRDMLVLRSQVILLQRYWVCKYLLVWVWLDRLGLRSVNLVERTHDWLTMHAFRFRFVGLCCRVGWSWVNCLHNYVATIFLVKLNYCLLPKAHQFWARHCCTTQYVPVVTYPDFYILLWQILLVSKVKVMVSLDEVVPHWLLTFSVGRFTFNHLLTHLNLIVRVHW